ncbi:hypothetical protein HBI56_084140 [Parastagonospora nodorum]|nr:hypothetical protein HBI10_118440 [Parastagonospora nodorum]KAH4025204.1 hypothetical protein HBI13_078750 [Parastagonospora nodorum]KAH4067837.1 hypothetical protein HBH50_132650 [Parastagonospora nodorum]KAH4086936.1 hypothetical protein HBH48_142070 [Parastagonospora nodorum]KAH4090370.1 hypothetical protein HBH46_189520 [Parastagonospora nodorum]
MSPQSARAELTLADAANSGGPEEVSKETMMDFYLRGQSSTVRQTLGPCVTATPKTSVAREGYTTIIVTPEDVAFSSEEELQEEEEKMRQRIWYPVR